MAKQTIKKGDKVQVIAGNSKGKIATVVSVDSKSAKVIVEGVALATKHLKPTSSTPNGSIVKKEMPIHVSNVQLLDSNGHVTRVSRRINKEGKTERFSLKTGNTI
jgi:large subunit ribosomal protein L24